MGNTYRSRLAEAYLNSLGLPGVSVISSGVAASRNENGPLSWYAAQLLHKYGLKTKPGWTQLTQDLLDKSDIVICVNRAVYRLCREQYQLPERVIVWDVPDVYDLVGDKDPTHSPPEVTERTFRLIRHHVDELTFWLRRPRHKEQLDILTPDGQPTGQTTDINTAHIKGYWHGGVHGLVYSPTGKVLMGKRSQTIVSSPGLWEIGFGGIITAGETPEQTLLREGHEELGLNLETKPQRKLGVWRYNHYLPRYGLHTRCQVHTFFVQVSERSRLKLQESEVTAAEWVPLSRALAAAARARWAEGQVVPQHRFNHWMLESLAAQL